jgi:PTS system nitrogen regulatory IIA component
LIKLTSIVSAGAVVVPLASGDRDAAITELVDVLVKDGVVPSASRDEVIGKVLARERIGSTGFGKGVAVPHVKHKAVARLAAAVGLSTRGIDFNSLDRQPVYTVFLLLSPEDRPEDHLQAMEVIFRNLGKETFRRFLRQARSAADVLALLEEADGQSLAG